MNAFLEKHMLLAMLRGCHLFKCILGTRGTGAKLKKNDRATVNWATHMEWNRSNAVTYLVAFHSIYSEAI